MEFITVDGTLTIEGNTLHQKRLTDQHRFSRFLSVFFFLFVLNIVIKNVRQAIYDDKTYWIGAGIYSLALLLCLPLIYDFLFRRTWKKKIDVLQVSAIQTQAGDAGLETHVILVLRSGRYKKYSFRTRENQAEDFIDALRSVNPDAQRGSE